MTAFDSVYSAICLLNSWKWLKTVNKSHENCELIARFLGPKPLTFCHKIQKLLTNRMDLFLKPKVYGQCHTAHAKGFQPCMPLRGGLRPTAHNLYLFLVANGVQTAIISTFYHTNR